MKQFLAAGQTDSLIAAATGISRPSIQIIKKSLGVAKARNVWATQQPTRIADDLL